MELGWVVIDCKTGSKRLKACPFSVLRIAELLFRWNNYHAKKITITKGAYLFSSVGMYFSVLYSSSVMNMIFCPLKDNAYFLK